MDPIIDSPKLPEMVMCGDHPSFTKNELNAKEPAEDTETPLALPRPKFSNTSFRDKAQAQRARASTHVLRARRTERALGELGAGARAHSGALVQEGCSLNPHAHFPFVVGYAALARGVAGCARRFLRQKTWVTSALGSFRWPPYLVGVWVVVLVLTHALHAVVGCLERALPRLRAFCQYLRSTAERSWHTDKSSTRLYPGTLAALAAAFYAVYFALYVVYSIALWSIEPLAEEVKVDSTTKVTDYTDISDNSMN